jgi:dipeptidyl aminopeptidase/acylaminoacyl peptidase
MKKFSIFTFLIFAISLSFAQNKLTPELLWKFGRVSDVQVSPDKKQILYGITKYSLEANKGNRDLYVLTVATGAVNKITESEGSEWNGVWRPDGKKIGYLAVEGGAAQLWEMNADGTDKQRISFVPDGMNGFAYAPDMKHIVYFADVKLDTTVTDRYPDLPKADAAIYDDLMYRHWDNWTDFAYSHVFIADYIPGMTKGADLMPAERFDSPLTPDGGIEQIGWSPAGDKLVYCCRKLHGREEAVSTNSDIYLYDITSKKTSNLSAGMTGYDLDPVFSHSGKQLAWCSMSTPGYESDKKRLIIYDFATQKWEDYTPQFEESVSNLRWSSDDKIIYFTAYIKGTCQVFQVDLASRKVTQLTYGVHDITELYADGSLMVCVQMSMSMPSEIYKWDVVKGNYTETQLTFTNKDLLSQIKMGKVEERWITTSDNKKMLVWVIYPPDFDKTKKYPALLYCQGGPQSTVSQFFSYRWNFQMMAANGYIVVAPNRRGLPGFGKAWNDEIAQDYGGQNMVDYLTAIDSVAREPYVNKDKLGAVGASYGAFSVYWLAGNHNHRFKAFIAHCGMFNLESWYGTTEEMWFANHDLGGAYWDAPMPKSYAFSPNRFVGNWDTPILVIHGGYDFRIPYTEGMQAFNAAQLKGIPSRFLFFPNETHFVTKPQNSVLWQREFFRWLDTYLK